MLKSRLVCDNHNDRDAVVTHYAAPFFLGAREGLLNAPVAGPWLDLCEECAAVLGWETPADEYANDAQRRLIFARCRDVGIDEDERHALLERVTGDESMRNLLAKDVDRVLTALDAEEAVRRGG